MSDSNYRQSLEGRLPVLPEERIYGTFRSVLWTWATFAGVSAAFLVGIAIPRIGNKEVGIAAYATGNIVAFVLVVLSAGLPSVRYGVETVDATKASFGTRGMIVPFVGELIILLGTNCVIAALTATATANIVRATVRINPTATWLTVIGVLILAVSWVVASGGPKLFERIAAFTGPPVIAISAVVLVLMFLRLGVSGSIDVQLPVKEALTDDKLKGFMLAFEWGAAWALTWWPITGGITRLVKKQNDILTPPIFAFGVLCPLFPVAAAALASVTVGTHEATWWLVLVGGRIFGTIAIAIVVFANIIIIVIQFYLAAVASQQIRALTGIRWDVLIALLEIPGVCLAFWPNWVLSGFTAILTYLGVLFAPIAAVTFVDYNILRKQQLEVRHLFTRNPAGRYYFWRGFNAIAIAIVVFGYWFDLWMYNPVSMASQKPFRYVGSTIPTVVACAVLYYVLMRIIAIPLKKGGYTRRVGDAPREYEVNVAL